MDERLFEVILAVISVLGTLITTFVIPLLREKIGAEKFNKYQKWAMIAVKAAEMIFKESGMGVDKKQFVTQFLKKMFNSKKTVLTDEQIDALIEACVKEMKIAESK